MVLRSESPFQTMDDVLTAAAKGLLSYATRTTLDRLTIRALEAEKGIAFDIVPPQGGSGKVPLLLAGKVDFAWSGGTHAQYTGSGAVHLIAAMTSDRQESCPDLPTFEEATDLAIPMEDYRHISVPAGTPEDVMATLETALEAAGQAEAFVTLTRETLRFPVRWIPGAELRGILETERDDFAPWSKPSGKRTERMPFSTYRAERVGRIEALTPGRVTAGEHTTPRLRFTAGDFGIDDTGGLKISWRQTPDMGKPQTTDPAGAGFTRIEAGPRQVFDLSVGRNNIRPWTDTLHIRVGRFLRPGDRFDVVIGCRDAPGSFVALPDYEWSGNTGVGGDHNLLYAHEGAPILRSSCVLLPPESEDEAAECPKIDDLFAALDPACAAVIAHVGGRDALRRRSTVATAGNRVRLEMEGRPAGGTTLIYVESDRSDAPTRTDLLSFGAIARTDADRLPLSFDVGCPGPILGLDLFDGTDRSTAGIIRWIAPRRATASGCWAKALSTVDGDGT